MERHGETLVTGVGDRSILYPSKPLKILVVCSVLLKNSSHFHEILDRLIHLYADVVKSASNEISDAIRGNPKRWPAFKDCVGALDGFHFFAYVPITQQKRFRNRHGDLTQNVLAVVDFEMNFTYVLAGW